MVDDAVTVGHTANGGDYVNESANVEVTITENDTPTLSIADGSAAEDAGSVTFYGESECGEQRCGDGDLCYLEWHRCWGSRGW